MSGCFGPHPTCLSSQATSAAQAPDWQPPLSPLGSSSSYPCMYDLGWEGINHFTTLGADYFNVSSRVQYSSSNLVVFQHGGHSSDCQKVGYPGIDPGCCQCTYLSFFYHIHNVAYCGHSQDHRGPSHKVGQIQDYEGYLILIIALDSISLNPYDDIANRLSEGVSQACADDSSAYKVWERSDIQWF